MLTHMQSKNLCRFSERGSPRDSQTATLPALILKKKH